jgi:hypothetical protein
VDDMLEAEADPLRHFEAAVTFIHICQMRHEGLQHLSAIEQLAQWNSHGSQNGRQKSCDRHHSSFVVIACGYLELRELAEEALFAGAQGAFAT